MRRELPLWRRPVTYGAIGATKADDLLTYPPAGYRPMRKRARIGHGDARFEWAATQAMTWGIQRLSGFDVAVADAPREVTDATYLPVTYDTDGAPVEPSTLSSEQPHSFGADGSAYLVPGDTAVLTIRFLLIPVKAAVRIVYVVDEPDRRGFGYGTLRGHPERGEESFIIERASDGSVWLELSAFSRPSTWYWKVLFLPLRAAQLLYTAKYLRVLAGPVPVPGRPASDGATPGSATPGSPTPNTPTPNTPTPDTPTPGQG